jgi:predicted O-methyltransferase YrrM
MSTKPRCDYPSRLISLDDDPSSGPSGRILNFVEYLGEHISTVEHPLLANRNRDGLYPWFKHWPGEHYNLLTCAAKLFQPKIIWEFCTYTGMGTIALAEGAPANCNIITVDNTKYKENWFEDSDFANGRILQLTGDMIDPTLFKLPVFKAANLIFVDGPKDGKTEHKFIRLLDNAEFDNNPIVIFDDIREPNMIYLWRDIAHPKMDLTSLGHFTGTGIVDWNG